MSIQDFDKGQLFRSFIDELEELDKDFARGIRIEEDFLQVKGLACIFPEGKEKHIPGYAAGLNLSSFTVDELSVIFRQIIESVDAAL